MIKNIEVFKPYLTSKERFTKVPINGNYSNDNYSIDISLENYLHSYVFFTKNKYDHVERGCDSDATCTQFEYKNGTFNPISWKECFTNRVFIDFDTPSKTDLKMWNTIIKHISKQYEIMTTKSTEYIVQNYVLYGIEDEFYGYYNEILVKKEK